MNNSNKNNRLNLTFRNNKLKLFPKHKLDIFNKSLFKYSTEANALFDKWEALGTPATTTRKIQVNNTINTLKSANIWGELDCLYMWAAHSKLAACVDWKNPATRSATLNSDYAGSFVTDGYTVSNGTFWIDTNYNPSTAVKFLRDDNSFGTYIKDQNNTTPNVVDLSCTTASTVGCEIGITANFQTFGSGNSSVQNSITGLTVSGLKSVKRTANNAWSIQQDGQDYYSGAAKPTNASLVLPNLNFYQCCRNINGARSLFSVKRYCYTFFGSSSVNAWALNNAININFLIPLSINIPKRITFNGNSFTAGITFPKRVMSNINDYNNICNNWRGISGQTTVQMQTDAVNNVFNRNTSAYTKDVLFAWELTNDMQVSLSNVNTCYNDMVNYCITAKAAMPNIKIIVATMLPRNQSQINNANRQNDLNLLDDTTLNGKIRNHLVQDGYCDAICDVASDAIMGIAGGELNTTYYNVDKIHPNTTGYNRLADNYITASLNAFL